MKKNLGIKTAVIIATLLVFVWGIFLGRDPQASIQRMREVKAEKGVGAALLAGIQQNIHLGLDLRGGTHLILQVMADEAVNSDSERAIERLKETLKTQNIPYEEINKPTGRVDAITVKGIPAEQTGAVRDLAGDVMAEYDVSSTPDGGLAFTMKPSVVRDIKARAVTQSIETIRARVDTLGVSEPVIQEHGLGENQILVQLPGVDDPTRVKDIIQSTAMLEIKQGFGQPYPTEAEALQAAQGLPGGLSDKIVMPGSSVIGKSAGQAFYIVSRASVVAGRDIRDARVTRDEAGRAAVGFSLTGAAGQRVGQFTSANVGTQLAVVFDNKVREVADVHQEISDEW